MRALFNSSGEKLFQAVEARFRTLLLPLPTNAYVFTVVDPFHPERRPKIWLRLQATACHRCRSEVGVRVCGDADLLDFWCGFAVTFILSCGIAVLQK